MFVVMKKYTFIFALVAIVVMSACGNGSTTGTEQIDSTTIVEDETLTDSLETESSEMLIDTISM